MFGINTLKKTVKELTQRVEKSESKIFHLERQIWEVKNPPKYKVGDKVGNVLITGLYIGDTKDMFGNVSFYHNYKIFDGKTNSFVVESVLEKKANNQPLPEKEENTEQPKLKYAPLDVPAFNIFNLLASRIIKKFISEETKEKPYPVKTKKPVKKKAKK